MLKDAKKQRYTKKGMQRNKPKSSKKTVLEHFKSVSPIMWFSTAVLIIVAVHSWRKRYQRQRNKLANYDRTLAQTERPILVCLDYKNLSLEVLKEQLWSKSKNPDSVYLAFAPSTENLAIGNLTRALEISNKGILQSLANLWCRYKVRKISSTGQNDKSNTTMYQDSRLRNHEFGNKILSNQLSRRPRAIISTFIEAYSPITVCIASFGNKDSLVEEWDQVVREFAGDKDDEHIYTLSAASPDSLTTPIRVFCSQTASDVVITSLVAPKNHHALSLQRKLDLPTPVLESIVIFPPRVSQQASIKQYILQSFNKKVHNDDSLIRREYYTRVPVPILLGSSLIDQNTNVKVKVRGKKFLEYGYLGLWKSYYKQMWDKDEILSLYESIQQLQLHRQTITYDHCS